MTAVVKTVIPARPVKSFVSTNIPFLDRNNPDGFSTSFQEDFKPLSFKKVEPVCKPTTAQVDHKDLRYINMQLTETMASYHHHPLQNMTRTPRWTKLYSNLKMQTDPGEVTFLTTQSQTFCPKPFQPPSTSFRPLTSINNQQVEKLPESTNKSTFTPRQSAPVVKATAKHLEEGFPTIKGDNRHCSFVSHYNNIFQGAWSRAAQPVAKHSSSVAMGDPVKIVDRDTTYTTSFSQPTVWRHGTPLVKEDLKVNLGHFFKDSWLSTSKEAFCYHKLEDPVVVTRWNRNCSSLPNGDTDVKRNRDRMSFTTNRISFSDLNHKEHPVFVLGSSLMTKSHVKFSTPSSSGLYYTTTASEHYSKKDGEPTRSAIQLPSNILSGPEFGLSHSTTKADFTPLKTCRQGPCLSQKKSNIKFPLAEQDFSTTHGEHYKARPLITARSN